ncbi:MAG: hypothetical protein IJ374_11675 [Lachnospiraceae bacterium]|nr:hypothetical protein [Lachnospiraceae bacterium]
MSKLCIDLPPTAPDYSGAASALFDLGGIVVMHDASGCTGNYTGFDEPRWLGSRSAVYCSGLRRMDVIMGNDKKFIDGALAAAKDLDPTMIAYLGSPVPMVIGIDLEGMAMETENASGIPSFGFNTTGQHYYDKGASDVFVKLIKRFAKKPSERKNDDKKRANVLGLLSIDMGNETNPAEICAFIEKAGYEINSMFAMGLKIEQIERVADADINIVISRCGLEAAIYMEKKYGIPYICGAPVGDGEMFLRKLHAIAEPESASIIDCIEEDAAPAKKGGVLIIHEQIMSNSIREAILEKSEVPVTVGSMYILDSRLAKENDLNLPNELSVRKLVNSGEYSVIIADPEIKKLIRRDDVTFIDLPHVAISGRLYLDRYLSYLGKDMENLIERAASAATK